jgi:hypothetical protein
MATLDSGAGQALIGIIIGLVVVGVPLLIRFLVKLYNGQKNIMDVLTGADPTPLVPNPPPGLVEIVASLLKDSKPNNGSSGRDVLDRIDRATSRE